MARELSGRRDVACVAACLSVLCATLRYHTADTMSHGLCALLLCAGIWRALRALRHDAALSGLALGWLFATRPISGLVGVAIALCLLDRRLWRLGWFGLGLVPGVTLFFFYQRAATGSFWSSTQLSYYAVADGPPGCFRYGFGSGIGCLFEHGEYVRARLTGGYGFREAARVTLGRLAVHSIDVANMAPLSVLCIVGAWLARGQRGVRAIFFGCLAFMLAYTPFYFDGSYPGGGARLFADLLPLEHVLLAIALVRLEWYVAALPLSLIGFACHASFAHRALSEREGGRPMFEAPVLARAGVDHGLVFVDTDHGWNLGHDPAQFDAQTQIVVARYEHDAHDWLLWNRLDRPRSYRYLYSTAERLAEPRLVPYTPTKTLRFEAEAEWPPLGVSNGWARPDFFPCASGGRALRLQPSGPQATMALEWEFALADAAPHHLWLGWVRTTGQAAEVRLTLAGGSRAFGAIPAGATECVEVDLGWVELSSAVTTARLESSAAGMFDYVEVRP